MTTVIIFTTSLFLLIGLFVLKQKELKTGIVYVPVWRSKMDQRAVRAMHAITEQLPRASKIVSAHTALHATRNVAVLRKKTARFIEHKAQKTIDLIEGRQRPISGNGSVSPFLRDVSEHKNEVRKQSGMHK